MRGGLNCGVAFEFFSTDLLANSCIHAGGSDKRFLFRKLVENYPVDRQSFVTLASGFELALVEHVALCQDAGFSLRAIRPCEIIFFV